MKNRSDTLHGALRSVGKHWKTLLLLNVLFLLHALPVVTFGMSLGALTRCCVKLSEGETVTADNFRAEFKENRVDNSKTGFFWLAVVGMIGVALWLCYRSVLRLILLLFLVFVFCSGILVYFLPLAYMVEIPLLTALQNAGAMGPALAMRTVPAFAFWLIWGGAIYMWLPYTLVLVLLGGAALPIFISCAIGWPGIKEHVIQPEDDVPSSEQIYRPGQ